MYHHNSKITFFGPETLQNTRKKNYSGKKLKINLPSAISVVRSGKFKEKRGNQKKKEELEKDERNIVTKDKKKANQKENKQKRN